MADAWPALPWRQWADTRETLHLMTQVVGKIRMAQGPWLNHSWGVTLHVGPRGLRSSLVPHGTAGFELAFDLLDHRLELSTTTGHRAHVGLGPTTMAEFHDAVLSMMAGADLPTRIHPMPSEIAGAVPLDTDTTPRGYEPEQVEALFAALVQADRVMARFRAGYLGKASPVHFFWGGFDLATTRFSGRTAPPHPGGLPNFPSDVAAEAYSHELTSVGLWFGDRSAPEPVFYSYAYPTPDGFASAAVEPSSASWVAALGEFVLPYDAARASSDTDAELLAFFSSTHAAAANSAGWDRSQLECTHPMGPDWWVTR